MPEISTPLYGGSPGPVGLTAGPDPCRRQGEGVGRIPRMLPAANEQGSQDGGASGFQRERVGTGRGREERQDSRLLKLNPGAKYPLILLV